MKKRIIRYNNCGSCQYFFKFKNDSIGGGLCERLDARTKSDRRLNCKYFKRIKYNRNKEKISKIKEIMKNEMSM